MEIDPEKAVPMVPRLTIWVDDVQGKAIVAA